MIFLFLLIFIVFVFRGIDWYIFCELGNDSWLCDRIKLCKYIWKVVILVFSKDYIYLDGINIDNDFYIC